MQLHKNIEPVQEQRKENDNLLFQENAFSLI